MPFSVYRSDRVQSAHGGVCVITRDSSVKAVQVETKQKFANIEVVAIDILNVLNPIRVITVYRSPSSDTGVDAVSEIKQLISCLRQLCEVNRSIIIAGDFNLPSINWSNLGLVADRDSCSVLFAMFANQYGFDQHVDTFTRPSMSARNLSNGIYTGSILDLVLSNDTHIIHNVEVNELFSTSDHCTIDFNLSFLPLKSDFSHCFPVDVNYHDFSKCNWDDVNNYFFNVDWSAAYSECLTAEQHTDVFYCILDDCIDQFVPIYCSRRTTHYRGINYPPHIRKLLLKKKNCWRLYRKFGTNVYYARYRLVCSQCRKAIHCFIANREDALISTGNMGKFYRYASSKLNCRTNVGSLKQPDGNLTIDPQIKASLLSNYFNSTFTADDGSRPLVAPRSSTKMHSIVFTQQHIFRVLSRLKANSAGGPDGIPPIFLKNVRSLLAAPLAFLYQLLFESTSVPAVWLKAHVTPIFKKGDSSCPSNYRPISLTCSLCKVMESIIKDKLVSFLASNGLLSREQHAFIAKHSTVTNLLECVHDWSLSLHNKVPMDVVYFDFSHAFDSVVHSKLLIKLQSFGLEGKLLTWIGAFLSGRSQCVVVEGMFSNWVGVASGVPQGSVLGPILFILFVDDITQIYPGQVTFKLFADDLKMYSSVESSVSSASLTTAISLLQDWCHVWQLTVNISKTFVVHLGFNNPLFCYTFNHTIISATDTIRDLGVEIDTGLSFDVHISKLVAKASARVGTLFRGFSTRNPNLLRKAYITYIRPILDYASNVWSPFLLKHIYALEKVQRRFTKRIPALHNLPYAERLATLNLDTLEHRRLKSDLTLYYKILNNLTPWPSDLYFNITPHQCFTRLSELRPDFYITKPLCNTSLFENCFFNRCISCWNNLPNTLINLKNLPLFKHSLAHIDLSTFLRYKF